MGSLDRWAPGSCSRIAFALTYMAAYIDRAVPEGDSFCVMAFSNSMHSVLGWRDKGGSFGRDEFLRTCKSAIGALPRRGTNLFGAFQRAYEQLASKPLDGAPVSAGGGGGAENAHGAGRAVGGPRMQQLVLLTDGEATDPPAFERAHVLACNPAPDFDFKAFLVSRGAAGQQLLSCSLPADCVGSRLIHHGFEGLQAQVPSSAEHPPHCAFWAAGQDPDRPGGCGPAGPAGAAGLLP
jgi:hypothetical protein